jgi:hypothetical protein
MLLKRNNTDTSGIFFAIWPRWTPDGWCAFERLHWEYVGSWGWGSYGYYKYSRLPDKWEDDGATSEIPFKRDPPLKPDHFFTAPQEPVAKWPSTCTYPNCTCMNEHGSNCPGGPP